MIDRKYFIYLRIMVRHLFGQLIEFSDIDLFFMSFFSWPNINFNIFTQNSRKTWNFDIKSKRKVFSDEILLSLFWSTFVSPFPCVVLHWYSNLHLRVLKSNFMWNHSSVYTATSSKFYWRYKFYLLHKKSIYGLKRSCILDFKTFIDFGSTNYPIWQIDFWSCEIEIKAYFCERKIILAKWPQ